MNHRNKRPRHSRRKAKLRYSYSPVKIHGKKRATDPVPRPHDAEHEIEESGFIDDRLEYVFDYSMARWLDSRCAP